MNLMKLMFGKDESSANLEAMYAMNANNIVMIDQLANTMTAMSKILTTYNGQINLLKEKLDDVTSDKDAKRDITHLEEDLKLLREEFAREMKFSNDLRGRIIRLERQYGIEPEKSQMGSKSHDFGMSNLRTEKDSSAAGRTQER